jgi:hypothetical protein
MRVSRPPIREPAKDLVMPLVLGFGMIGSLARSAVFCYKIHSASLLLTVLVVERFNALDATSGHENEGRRSGQELAPFNAF